LFDVRPKGAAPAAVPSGKEAEQSENRGQDAFLAILSRHATIRLDSAVVHPVRLAEEKAPRYIPVEERDYQLVQEAEKLSG
jgi:hypothetical protein